MDRKFKIGIIVIWMGKLPSHFPLWVRSLKKNSSFDFFVFTDQLVGKMDVPENLKLVHLTFRDLRKIISKKLLLETNIQHPYKLCDFKPAYGEIFSDYLLNYDFWGCCDIDVLFGDLKKFITTDLLLSYKKIFSRGHLTLYRNESAINAAYRSSKHLDAKRILQSKEYFLFDEWHGIHKIFGELGIDQYNNEVMADIKVYSTRLVCTNIENFKNQIFVWEEGNVKQYYIKGRELRSAELAYMHFQKRRIILADPDVYTSKSIILNPQSLLPFNEIITGATVSKYDRSNYSHYIHSQIKRIKKTLSPFTNKAISINKALLPESHQAR